MAMRGQLQETYNKKGSNDMNTRQVESSVQEQFDNLQEQLNIANQRFWHVEQSAENIVELI